MNDVTVSVTVQAPLTVAVTTPQPLTVSVKPGLGPQGVPGQTGAPGTTDYNQLTNKPAIPTLMSQLTDIDVTSRSDGSVLVWNGSTSKWVSTVTLDKQSLDGENF